MVPAVFATVVLVLFALTFYDNGDTAQGEHASR
jgi:hypothetical protein